MFECPAIDTVVRRIQGTLGKPGDIAILKATRPDMLEGPIPVERLAGNL
jgi:hypothetical protein